MTQAFEFKTRVSADEKLSHNTTGPMVEWWFVSMTSSIFVCTSMLVDTLEIS